MEQLVLNFYLKFRGYIFTPFIFKTLDLSPIFSRKILALYTHYILGTPKVWIIIASYIHSMERNFGRQKQIYSLL